MIQRIFSSRSDLIFYSLQEICTQKRSAKLAFGKRENILLQRGRRLEVHHKFWIMTNEAQEKKHEAKKKKKKKD
jgi:hypothetical protein